MNSSEFSRHAQFEMQQHGTLYASKCHKNQPIISRFVLHFTTMQTDFEAHFLYAAKNGYIERAERLLLDGNYDPSHDNNVFLYLTSQ